MEDRLDSGEMNSPDVREQFQQLWLALSLSGSYDWVMEGTGLLSFDSKRLSASDLDSRTIELASAFFDKADELREAARSVENERFGLLAGVSVVPLGSTIWIVHEPGEDGSSRFSFISTDSSLGHFVQARLSDTERVWNREMFQRTLATLSYEDRDDLPPNWLTLLKACGHSYYGHKLRPFLTARSLFSPELYPLNFATFGVLGAIAGLLHLIGNADDQAEASLEEGVPFASFEPETGEWLTEMVPAPNWIHLDRGQALDELTIARLKRAETKPWTLALDEFVYPFRSVVHRDPTTMHVYLLIAFNLQTGKVDELLLGRFEANEGDELQRLLVQLITDYGRPMRLITDNEAIWNILRPTCDLINMELELVGPIDELDEMYGIIGDDLEDEYDGHMLIMPPDSPGWLEYDEELSLD